MLRYTSSDNSAYHSTTASSLSQLQYELDRSHNLHTRVLADTCTCCCCCSSSHTYHPQSSDHPYRTCNPSRFSSPTNILDKKNVDFHNSEMKSHLGVGDGNGGDHVSFAEIPRRLSRFHEQLTSTHTPTTSLHEISTVSVPPPSPIPTPLHVPQTFARKRKPRFHRQECNLFRSPKPKLKAKPRFGKQSDTATNSVAKTPVRRLNVSSSVASLASSHHRRSLTIEKLYAHRLARKVRKKREKEEREKQESKLKGTVWGYDPTAGRLVTHEARCTASHSALHDIPSNVPLGENPRIGCYIFRGARRYSHGSDEYGSDEIDNLGRRTGRSWV